MCNNISPHLKITSLKLSINQGELVTLDGGAKMHL